MNQFLTSRQWVEHFRVNADTQLPIHWQSGATTANSPFHLMIHLRPVLGSPITFGRSKKWSRFCGFTRLIETDPPSKRWIIGQTNFAC